MRKIVDMLRPNYQIHMAHAVDDLLAFLLGNATCHANGQVRMSLLMLSQLTKHTEYFLLGFTTDRAGIEKNERCFFKL